MIDMDVSEDLSETKKCFKCKHQILDSLNVECNATNSVIIIWNKYQLFLYENLNFDNATRIFTPEFIVHQIIASNNYLLCLDCSGTVHVTSLKFKSTQKRSKTNFQPREHNVLVFVQQDDFAISLKFESENYYLCYNKIDSEFHGSRKIAIKNKDDTWPLATTQEKCFIATHKLPNKDESIRELFNLKDATAENTNIVILSVDRMNVYCCLINPEIGQHDIKLIKLYSCPSEICNIQITELEETNLIVVLNSGTVIKLPLQKSAQPPTPVHLNTAVSNFVSIKDTLIYTDGVSMWKTEKTFSKIVFQQYFIKHVKDFARYGDRLICTTYSNLIYLISYDNTCYVKPESEIYCAAEKLLNNSEYLNKLLEEVKKNNELIERLNKEGNYITALALSNRQDLMDGILKNNVIVYEHYEDAVKENPDLKITEDLENYFKAESLYFLINMKIMQMEHLVNQILSQLLHNSKIHVSLLSEFKLLKTNSLSISESLSKINILIPLGYNSLQSVSVIKVNIKIVTHVPGAFDPNEPVWITLYKKEIILNSEHFIKLDLISNRMNSLKEPQETIEELISKTTQNQHGNVFQITDISNIDKSTEFSTYVKLPVNFTEIFKNQELFKHFNERKADYLFKQLSSDEFLKSNSNLTFEVGTDKVDVEILSEEVPLLKVGSKSATKAMRLRNFFADLLYGEFGSAGEDRFADYAFYTTAENIQKAIKISSNPEDLKSLTDQFQKTVIGALPI